MTHSLNVAFIGTGGIARTHVPGWLASPHTEIVMACDINPAAAESFARTHNIPKWTTNPADVFGNPDIHIIDVCTPNMFHTQLVIGGLDAGKHVLCEKPLAPTPGEVRQMIAARDRAGKLLMTAQHFRFRGDSQAVKKEIDLGVLGNVYHARSWMLRRNGFHHTPAFVSRAQAGGGPCIDIGVHILDLTLWFMGNPRPVAVTGVAKAPLAHHPGQFAAWHNALIPDSFDVEDFAAAFVRFESGASLVLEVSWLLHHNIEGEDAQVWLYGDEGGCHWPKAEFLSTNYETRQLYNRTLKLTRDRLEPHAQECVEFAQAIVDGAPSPAPPEQSLQVIAILDAVYRSQREGREVAVDI